MGSGQSRNRQQVTETPPSSSPGPSPATRLPHPPRLPRFSSLRRLSALAQRQDVKRNRPGSPVTADEEGKKRRLEDLGIIDDGESSEPADQTTRKALEVEPPGIPPDALSTAAPIPPTLSVPTPSVNSSLIIPSLGAPLPQPRSDLSPTTLPSDPLLGDHLRTLPGIHDTLGPDWPSSAASTPVESLARRFGRRQSLPLEPPDDQQGLSDSLTAVLGISSVEADSSATTTSEPSLEEIQERIHQSRQDLDDAQRQLDQARAHRDQGRRIPAGAVLVIQGLAQTHAGPDETSDSPGEASAGRSRPSLRPRRSSESNAHRPRTDDHNGASLETQARMIGGLLTVAAAATATTLLSPDRPPLPRRAPSGMLENVLNRIRPNRLRSSQTIESALGNYLRTVLREGRRLDDSRGISEPPTAEASEVDISNEFQRFLEGLQIDLVGAVREFATEAPQSVEVPVPTSTTLPNSGEVPNPPEAISELPSIPTFHRQLGQNLPEDRTSGVSGGADGLPRRLDFFRAHLFPAVPTGTAEDTVDGDTNDMVPCIFIGVRSISHDSTLTTQELMQHPSFPFIDGHIPAPSTEASDPALPDSPAPPVSAPAAERRSLRERVLDRLTPRRERPPQGPLNTYLVYVIGGNYPRSHPVLSIPNLITGGPLTDEEMQLVGELMGPVRPPTASKDDIEKSGLKLVDGGDMKRQGEKGAMLDSCVERCLICLSEYESGEECRILNCRHGYHKECVDKWLNEGRNSCPACRTEAVGKGTTGNDARMATPGDPASAAVSSEQHPGADRLGAGPSGSSDTDVD